MSSNETKIHTVMKVFKELLQDSLEKDENCEYLSVADKQRKWRSFKSPHKFYVGGPSIFKILWNFTNMIKFSSLLKAIFSHQLAHKVNLILKSSYFWYLRLLSKLREATISFVCIPVSSHVLLSVRMKQLGTHWTDLCKKST